MSNDTELLRRYVQEGCESAFGELVHDHVNMVYSAALRQMGGDGALAEDISQAVFTELARKAPRLLNHPTLAGWLYTAVRNMAANLRRSEEQRRRREEKAQIMNELVSDADSGETWQRIQPVLDEALHELKEADREALVLRFLEEKPLGEVGERLGINENAARMRVDRALEKLRACLARRGITSTATSLVAALAIGVVTPAPAALATTITTAALAGGVAAGSSAVTLIKLMSITKVSLVGALVVAGVTVPVWQQARLQRARAENQKLLAQEAESRAQSEAVPVMREELERLRKMETDKAELERLRTWRAQTEPELLRLRGMAGVARRANAEAEQLRAQFARQAIEGGTNPASGAMANAMTQAMEQQVDGQLSRMTASLHLTPEQAQAAREILNKQARLMSAGMQQALSGKFDKEELARLGKDAVNTDEKIKALLTAEQRAAYPKYQNEEAAQKARLAASTDLLQIQSTLGLSLEQEDQAFAALYELSFNQLTGNVKPAPGTQVQGMDWVLDLKSKALEPILTAAQMEKFRQQQAIQSKLAQDIRLKLEGPENSR